MFFLCFVKCFVVKLIFRFTVFTSLNIPAPALGGGRRGLGLGSGGVRGAIDAGGPPNPRAPPRAFRGSGRHARSRTALSTLSRTQQLNPSLKC